LLSSFGPCSSAGAFLLKDFAEISSILGAAAFGDQQMMLELLRQSAAY
jgi:hypothetical protein